MFGDRRLSYRDGGQMEPCRPDPEQSLKKLKEQLHSAEALLINLTEVCMSEFQYPISISGETLEKIHEATLCGLGYALLSRNKLREEIESLKVEINNMKEDHM